MFVKPISNAGLILLLAVAAPWILKTVKRIKVGEYLEFENLSPSESERKLETEAQELLEDDVSLEEAEAKEATSSIDTTFLIPSTERIKEIMRNIRITESIVLDWVERSLGVPVRREVRMGDFAIDGVALTKPVPTIVEVKVLSRSREVTRRLREVTDTLNKARQEWRFAKSEWPRAMVVLATNSSPEEQEYEDLLRRVEMYERGNVDGVEIKLFSMSDLLGMPPRPSNDADG